MNRTGALTIGAALALGAAFAAGAGQVVIVESDVDGLTRGSVIEGTRTVTLVPDSRVVLITASGRTVVLEGPYEGAIEPAAPSAEGTLVDSLSRLLREPGGDAETLAVARKYPGAEPAGRADVWGIHIATTDVYCVRADHPPVLWWPGGRVGAVVVLEETTGRTRVRLRWPEGKRQQPWPERLPVIEDGSYVAMFREGDPGERFTLRYMPRGLVTDAHRAAWMAEHGCTRQALRVLAAVAKR